MAFVGRALSFTFTKGGGGTFPNGSTSITIPPGNMAQVRVTQPGMPGMGGLQASVWGLTADIMNQVNTLGVIVTLQPAKNFVTIEASDDTGANKSVVFTGAIYQCVPDFNQQPESPLTIEAWAGLDIASLPFKPISFTGGADLIVMLQQICSQVGYKLENNGVSGVQLNNPYQWGSARDAIEDIRRSVINRGVTIDIDVLSRTVAVWYTQKSRGGGAGIPLVTPGTATAPGTLIGYPAYTMSGVGIKFRCIYTPQLRRGGQVQLETSLPSGKGLFTVYGLAHSLDAQIPGGRWESQVEATRQGYPVPQVSNL